jgi:cysteine-rich repeat protein
MARWIALIASSMVACVGTDVTTCPDGTLCPAGLHCAAVTIGERAEHVCVRPEAEAACVGLEAGTACELGGRAGTCHGGACIADQCGNGLVDATEACDDENTIAGDGCASDCRSDETCGNGIVDPVLLVEGRVTVNEQCDDGNLLSHDGCSSRCDVETPQWTPFSLRQPPGLARMGFAYDTKRGRALMFAGQNYQAGDTRELWSWTDGGWRHELTTSGPGPRMELAATYDDRRDRFVMFGGVDFSYSVYYADTWEYDGKRWSQVAGAGTGAPAERLGAALAFDRARGVSVLFGGLQHVTSTTYGDTWELSATGWQQRAIPGPPGRHGHAMAYDPVRGVIVVFGGADRLSLPNLFADTWTFDGVAWTQQPTSTAPSPRQGAAMAWDAVSQRMLLFGGTTTNLQRLADTWAWNGSTWEQLPVSGPSMRGYARMATDTLRGGIALYGGSTGDVAESPETWWWNGAAWSQLPTTSAPKLLGIGAVHDPRRQRTVAFGGAPSAALVTDTTLELADGRWREVMPTGVRPAARQRPYMIYDRGRGAVLLFGGALANETPIDDGTWTWDGVQWTRVSLPGSWPARRDMGVAHHAATGETIAFGGGVTTDVHADTYAWTGTTWELRPQTVSPPARRGASLGYDPLRRRTVLFGGTSGQSFYNDVWEWDGQSWTEIPALVRPSARHAATLEWNAARRRLILIGGISDASFETDTWEWDGTEWTSVDERSNTPRISAAFVGQPTGLWRLGGLDETLQPRNEHWHIRWEAPGEDERCDGVNDLDADGRLGCADPDCWFACTPLCAPGLSCATDAPSCGDGVCDPNLETCRMCPSDCGPCPVRCGDSVCDAAESATACPGDC